MMQNQLMFVFNKVKYPFQMKGYPLLKIYFYFIKLLANVRSV